MRIATLRCGQGQGNIFHTATVINDTWVKGNNTEQTLRVSERHILTAAEGRGAGDSCGAPSPLPPWAPLKWARAKPDRSPPEHKEPNDTLYKIPFSCQSLRDACVKLGEMATNKQLWSVAWDTCRNAGFGTASMSRVWTFTGTKRQRLESGQFVPFQLQRSPAFTHRS